MKNRLICATILVVSMALSTMAIYFSQSEPTDSESLGSSPIALAPIESSVSGWNTTAKDDAIDRARVSGEIVVTLSPACVDAGPFMVSILDSAGLTRGALEGLTKVEWVNIPFGEYTVQVERQGWSIFRTACVVSRELARCEVQAAPVPIQSMRGQVVSGVTGNPIETFEVAPEWQFELFDAAGYGQSVAKVITSRDGSYCLAGEDHRAEKYRIHVAAPGYEAASTDWMNAVGGELQFPVLELRPSTLSPAVIQGFVVDQGGRPIAGALVEAVGRDSMVRVTSLGLGEVSLSDSASQGNSSRIHSRVTADQAGRFSVQVNAGEAYRVVAWMEGYEFGVEEVRGDIEPSRPEIVIRLEAGCTVSGTILLSTDPYAVGFVRYARIKKDDFIAKREVERFGDPFVAVFKFAGVPRGRYTIDLLGTRGLESRNAEVTAVMASQTVTVDDSQADVQFDLGGSKLGRSISGVVSLPADAPPAQAIAYLFKLPDHMSVLRTSWVGGNGAFTFDGLEEGTYVVLVLSASLDASTLCTRTAIVECAALDCPRLTLGQPLSVVSGYLEEDGVRIQKRVLLRVKSQRTSDGVGAVLGKGWAFATTEQGEFQIRGLPVGSYEIESVSVGYLANFELEDPGAQVQVGVVRQE